MRVFRVLAGTVLLMVAAPALLAGVFSWYAMQHRDDAGRFNARFETIAHPGYAVVVPDVDAVLHRDAPFTRAGQTSVRLTASAGTQPLFLGLAAPADVAGLLSEAAYARVDGISLHRGPLGMRSTAAGKAGATPVGRPADQAVWLSSGLGSVEFEPADWHGKPVTLVVMAPDGKKVDGLALGAAVRFGWLDSTTWGLLILGPVLLLLGFIVLAWPSRQVVYVMVTPPGSPDARPARAGVSWMDLPTVELALLQPEFRPAPATFASASAPAASAAAGSPAVDAPGASAASDGAAEKKAKDEDWARPDPSVQWPPPAPEVPQPTPDSVDVPTHEMAILDELLGVPPQLNGVGRTVTASGPAGGGGSTLTGGTV